MITVVGGHAPRVHGAGDEGRHARGEPGWQESVLVHWWDDRAGIGGFHRIGHEVEAAGDRTNPGMGS